MVNLGMLFFSFGMLCLMHVYYGVNNDTSTYEVSLKKELTWHNFLILGYPSL
jgi:hypothetical protein